MESLGPIIVGELERMASYLPALPARASAGDPGGRSVPQVPDYDLEAKREDAKTRLAEYAEQLEAEKAERRSAESGSRRRRSDVESKALELLVEGAVGITEVVPGRVRALVEGDTGSHQVGWLDWSGWSCDCESGKWRRRCSHVDAVKRVVRLTTRSEEQ
jgi:hypothetical protein